MSMMHYGVQVFTNITQSPAPEEPSCVPQEAQQDLALVAAKDC